MSCDPLSPVATAADDPLLAQLSAQLNPLDQIARPGADTSGDLPAELRPAVPTVPAAVLVPLIAGPQGWELLLTVRARHLKKHAGQVSFPGGRQDPQDQGLLDTALRECEEEIDLPRRKVTALGALRRYQTITGYQVTPIVAQVHGQPTLTPDPGEVAEIFQVPLDYLCRGGVIRRESALFRDAATPTT